MKLYFCLLALSVSSIYPALFAVLFFTGLVVGTSGGQTSPASPKDKQT